MDCDDVMLMVAVGEGRTLSGVEELEYHQHVATCETCRALAVETSDDRLRWVARIPEDALDDPDLLVLPTVDPIVFAKGDELARGGMGRITRARDRRLGRDVAIKEVLSPVLRARFEREAMITAKLQHPAIVPVYEAGTWPDGSAFYTMRLVSGGTLSDAIARTHTLEDRLALLPHVLALTEALAYAHARRIVHRDLKPGNVLVGEFGETVVIDWGLAKELDRAAGDPDAAGGSSSSADLTHAGSVVGTPCFIAPEQAAGAEIDERADVYALGAILYNLLAGHPPHWDTTEHSADRLLAAAREVPPTPIAELAPRVPADLRAILERAMARDRQARYPSAKEMAEELRRFEAGQLLGSRQYGARELLVRWIRRHRAAVAVGAVAIAVLAIGGAISVQQIVARERETRHALAESQLEQGRQLFVDGDPAQAAPYLAAAFAELPGDPVAQRLAAAALRETPRRLGHFAGTVAAFRRDGAELAIGHADGSIAVIDPVTAALLRTLPALGGAIAGLDYAPDGARLAVASATGAYLCDPRTGARVTTASTAPATEVRFLPSGDRIAILGAAAVSLVGLDGKPVAADDQLAEPRALAVSRDGAHLAAVTRDGAIAWRASDLVRVAEANEAGPYRFVAVFEHGELITAGLDGVRRWGDRATTFVPDVIVTLAWLDDRTLLADRMIIATDTGAVRELTSYSIQAVARVDRTHAITGGFDHTLRLWDLERAAHPVVVLDAAAATEALIVDPTGRRAITRGRRAGDGIELWDVGHAPGPTRTAVVGGPQARIDALISDHRDRLAIHVHDGTAQTSRLLTAGLEPVAPLGGWPVGFRPNGDEIVTDDEGRLAIYSARDGRHLRDVDDPQKIWHVAFSRSGAVVATCNEHHVALRDAGWRVTESFDVSAQISAIAVDDEGRVVTGHEDGTLRIWDARGTLLATVTGHTTHVSDIAIHGGTFITSGWDPTMRRWAFPSGEPLGIIKNFDRIVESVGLSPGGGLLATADDATTVGLWDAAQGRLLDQWPASHKLASGTFIDDDHVITGGDGGRLELFDVSERLLPVDEVTRRVASSRWRLVRGRAVDRTADARR